MAVYNNSSLYYTTSLNYGYLDVLDPRPVPIATDDILYTLVNTYEYRPDLLAFHLYGDVNLWWVFASRNPEVIQDPIFDMKAGVKIYLPQMSLMKKSLGI